ncbi:MAG: hypothetical protein LBV12_11870 [Puniceicoccales bacterium]|nr:hypothetical protein [Puniceicoccales bacterium]
MDTTIRRKTSIAPTKGNATYSHLGSLAEEESLDGTTGVGTGGGGGGEDERLTDDESSALSAGLSSGGGASEDIHGDKDTKLNVWSRIKIAG